MQVKIKKSRRTKMNEVEASIVIIKISEVEISTDMHVLRFHDTDKPIFVVISVVVPSGGNLSSGDWWIGVAEEDASSPLPLDASEVGLWSGNFVPPPPRPIFLDEGVTSDGLTTCDLCSWAWQNSNAFTLDAAIEAPGEIGWVLTLVIVSLVSAVIGAIVMIIALHCRRMKNSGLSESEDSSNSPSEARQTGLHPPINTPNDKTILSTFPNTINNNHSNNGVWSWLFRRTTTAPPQLDPPPTSPAENHYTHMDETYSGFGEALYAELDRESTLDRDSNNPAYENSAYTDPDAPPSSAPSSAYYSDLSVTTIPDRAYEVVGLVTMPIWEGNNVAVTSSVTDNAIRRPIGRLAAISETRTVPSDYV